MPAGAIPFPFGRCRICVDKATGIHYGVATCEGCKGFFKRSITKAEKYRCFFGGSCQLTPKNRNRCKSCRFKRCLETGMALDAVKMGRIPKVEKERALEEEKEKSFDDGKDSEPVYQRVRDTSSSSSGVSSEERSPSDVSLRDLDGVTESKGFVNFQQDPPSGRDCEPVLPCLGNEYQDHLSLIHSQVESEKPVGMERVNPEVPVSLPNGTTAHGPIPRAFSADYHVPGKNGVKVGDSVPRGKLASYPDPGGLGVNGRCIPGDHSAESHAPVHIGMKVGEHVTRKVTESCPVTQPSVSLGNFCNAVTTPSVEQACSWGHPQVINSPASGDTRLQNGNERKTSMRSPGMAPSLVYNSEVVKQLFTHALENICQDGRNVQLIEKFLHTSDTATSSGRVSCQNSPAITVPSAMPGRDGMMAHTVVNQLQARTAMKVDEGQKRKNEEETDLEPKNKLVPTNPPSVNMNGVIFTGLKESGLRQPIPNQSPSYGMHKLPPTLPQRGAVTRPRHNTCTIPSSQYSSQSQPMALRPLDWYSCGSDSLFEDGNHMADGRDYPRHSTGNMLAQQPNTCQRIIRIKQEPQMDFQSSESDCPFGDNGQTSNSNVLYHCPQNGQFLKSEANFQANSCMDTTQCGSVGSDVKPDFCSNDIQIIESIFSDYATSSQTAEVELNGNNPMLPPNTDECFPLDDINVEVLDDENLCGEELVHHLQKWYEKIEVLSISMTKALHDSLKAGTHLENVIPLDSSKPKRQDAQQIWELLFSNVEPCGVRVANFCRIIPGFSRIESEDKDTLVTSAFFDLWLICHSPLFFEGEVHILFPQNCKIKYCRYWMSQFLPEELIKKFFNFCDVFNSCNLTLGEVAVVMAVRATLPERPGLKDLESVKKLNMRYLNLMVQTIITNHTNEGGNILKKLFMVLPLLNDINEHQNRVIGSFRIDQLPCQDHECPS